MAGGRRYRSFVHNIVLLLWVCLHYVKASSGKRVIHKKVGDTVELSSGLSTEGVTAATWRYGGITVADKDEGVSKESPFKDRSELNPEDFTLTVRKLTLQDSGDFTFVSEVNDEQRPSVSITLQVHDVETSSGKHVIHKKVGDTVELSSGLPTEGVTAATWKYGEIIIADKVIENNMGVSKRSPFKDRSELNQENFTLTVKKLTLQDSGDFIFVSATKEKQRDSVIITLQVHEPISKQPVIKINSTWISSNESCKVLLECSTTGDVSYKWTVGKQTLTGPRQQYIIRQDGETNVTCTVSNHVSEKSAFQTVKCSKDNSHRKETGMWRVTEVVNTCNCSVYIIYYYYL
ncbi:uncharacterized protein LOC102195963 [Pundamilia nyererei]|uniref:Uncharacterized protein LOC102195963 n=1 Tax=Pundamilia nyererei TaxID=303518 RepID=A0A9Y3SBD2_9CICH|nr:PREDICTED: uncharacterized protein LOC102195963 [Pundamilia nyererei]